MTIPERLFLKMQLFHRTNSPIHSWLLSMRTLPTHLFRHASFSYGQHETNNATLTGEVGPRNQYLEINSPNMKKPMTKFLCWWRHLSNRKHFISFSLCHLNCVLKALSIWRAHYNTFFGFCASAHIGLIVNKMNLTYFTFVSVFQKYRL